MKKYVICKAPARHEENVCDYSLHKGTVENMSLASNGENSAVSWAWLRGKH